MPQLLVTPTSLPASANTALIEALWMLEQRLATWSSNQDAFNNLLQQVFGVSPAPTALHRMVANALTSTRPD